MVKRNINQRYIAWEKQNQMYRLFTMSTDKDNYLMMEKIIELPNYEIVQKTDIDFELHVPEATKISLCKK